MLELAEKVKNGTATEEEKALFEESFAKLSEEVADELEKIAE